MQQLVAEILRRPWSLTQIRVVLQLALLTDGRGRADVVATIEQLARAVHSTRSHLSPVLEELIEKSVLHRDARTAAWSLRPVDDWAQEPDPELVSATLAVAVADEQRRQPAFFEQPSDAEWASEKQTLEQLGSVRKTDAPPTRARAPGLATKQPSFDAVRGTGLDYAQWQLLEALIAWCSETGQSCTPRQRADWAWRIWTRGAEPMAAALKIVVQHVADGQPCRSRFGLVKSVWQRLVNDDNFEHPPRSAVRLHGGNSALPAGGVHASAPVTARGALAPASAAGQRSDHGTDPQSDALRPPGGGKPEGPGGPVGASGDGATGADPDERRSWHELGYPGGLRAALRAQWAATREVPDA